MLFINHYFELIAALSGAFFWLKTKDRKTLPFIWYLWLTVIVETLALYPFFYGYEFGFLNYLESSVMRRNEWLYNIYSICGLVLLGMFFWRHSKSLLSRKTIVIVIVLTTVSAILYFVISGNFFHMTLPYDMAMQTAALFIIVMLYYRDLLKSDAVLVFYKSHVFYIGSALLLWNICLTPLFIFDGFFNQNNKAFIQFRMDVLLVSNILLYSCYTFAFIYTLYHRKKLVPKRLL